MNGEATARTEERIRTLRWPFAEGDVAARDEMERRIADTARRSDLINYTDLVRGIVFRLGNVNGGVPLELGVPEWTDLHSAILKDFLNHISCHSYLRARFLASAIVVSRLTREPSDGFRALVSDLGLLATLRREDFEAFWSAEVGKVHAWYATNPVNGRGDR